LKMTFNYYLPPKTYAFLVKIAEENKLSVKEVQRIFLNTVAADLGFGCEHLRIGFAKSDNKPYCKECWTRLRIEKREPYRIGTNLIKEGIRYVEKETFLDIHYREETRKKNHRDTNLKVKELQQKDHLS
jgi:hypothetical protein